MRRRLFHFALICNSSPAPNPPPAEEKNRTRTVETADGLSRRTQSGFRCAHRLLQIIDRGGGWQ